MKQTSSNQVVKMIKVATHCSGDVTVQCFPPSGHIDTFFAPSQLQKCGLFAGPCGPGWETPVTVCLLGGWLLWARVSPAAFDPSVFPDRCLVGRSQCDLQTRCVTCHPVTAHCEPIPRSPSLCPCRR